MEQNIKYVCDKEQQSKWFPYSISIKPNDFIIQNGVHGHCPTDNCSEECNQYNPSYWKNFEIKDLIKDDIEIGCFGCSFTYGNFLPIKDTWPFLIEQKTSKKTGNFGIPGGGADGCYTNLCNAHEVFKIKTAIILFPVMERRLLKFEKHGIFFQFPVGPHTSWPYDDVVSQNYFDRSFIQEKILKTQKELLLDEKNDFSKEEIMKIKKYCSKYNINLMVSSWDPTTYNFLKENGFNMLSRYDMEVTDKRAPGTHPTFEHNDSWTELIFSDISKY